MRRRQSGRVAGSFAERVGDPAAVACGAASVAATGMSISAPRTPAAAGPEAPFGEPSPAPGPPQPAVAVALTGAGSWGASWGRSGLSPAVPPDTVRRGTGVVAAAPPGLPDVPLGAGAA